MFRRIYRAIRFQYLKLVRIKDSSHKVALGMAIGVSVGALPCMGFQTIVALPFALLCGANLIAVAVGVWWTNPLTAVPVYYSEYLVGVFLQGLEPISYKAFMERVSGIEQWRDLLDLGLDILVPLSWGGILYAAVLLPLTYFPVHRFLEIRKRRMRLRRLKKRRRRLLKEKRAAEKSRNL